MARAARLICKYAFIFAVFCGAAGLFLASVYELVQPRKEAYQREVLQKSLRLLAPGADSFTPAQTAAGQNYHEACTAAGRLLGYVLETTASGYSSDLKILAGLNKDFELTGFKILEQAETPGLGTKAAGPEFAAKLLGRRADTLALKKDGGEIDAITGATITSRSVVDALRRAAENLKEDLRS
ncbi:MAG: FMN-binding protein [Candidatus Margulisbacteria bacterium]|jgi:electron transport complex protein RnfG|nr:FMN-binding protein [Candidatus Margulisiibacteriota bacterium]